VKKFITAVSVGLLFHLRSFGIISLIKCFRMIKLFVFNRYLRNMVVSFAFNGVSFCKYGC